MTGADRAARARRGRRRGVDLLIGTHALVQEGVEFADLSPRRRRRAAPVRAASADGAEGKGGGDIDVLIMTATPIPRTLALTYYGDLDVAIAGRDSRRAGSRSRRVAARTEHERTAAYDLVRAEVAAGRQAFVVCAAIDEGNRTAGEGGRERGRAARDRGLPGAAGRAAPRTHAPEGQGADHGRVPRGRGRRAHLDDRDRGRRRRAERHRDAGGERRALRPRSAPPAARSHRPRRLRRPPACCSTSRTRTTRRPERGSTRWSGPPTASSWPTRTCGCAARARCSTRSQSGMPDLKLARLAEDVDLVKRARARAFALVEDDPGLREHPELLDELRLRFEPRSTGCSDPERSGPVRPLGSPLVRIIAGAAKGTRLAPVPAGHPSDVRPGPGGALREPRGPGSMARGCLDLFAGTGAVGIEALSRGASEAVFVDATRRRRPMPSATTSRERTCPRRARVVKADVLAWLARQTAARGVFDLVFCDPPYDVAGAVPRPAHGLAGYGMACPGDVDRGPDPRS